MNGRITMEVVDRRPATVEAYLPSFRGTNGSFVRQSFIQYQTHFQHLQWF